MLLILDFSDSYGILLVMRSLVITILVLTVLSGCGSADCDNDGEMDARWIGIAVNACPNHKEESSRATAIGIAYFTCPDGTQGSAFGIGGVDCRINKLTTHLPDFTLPGRLPTE